MQASQDDPTDPRSVALMLASVGLFAANVLIIRGVALAAPAADGWLASLFRGAVGLVVVVALFGFGRGFQPRRLFASRLVAARGIVGALAIVAFYITISHLGAARAVVLNLTYPIFATVIAAVWLKEKLHARALCWMAASLAGLAVFLGEGGRLLRPSPYDLLGLAGAVAAGWVVVIIRRLRHEEHPATIYASQALYSLALAAPFAGKALVLPAAASVWLAGGAVIVAIAQLVMTRAYQRMPVSRGSAIQMLLPLVTAAGGFAFFGESFSPLELAGGALTLFATWRVVATR